jgi:hypothetical protein
MIYKNKNNILNYPKNEIKFRQSLSNCVHKRRFVSFTRELQASLTDDTTTNKQTTLNIN